MGTRTYQVPGGNPDNLGNQSWPGHAEQFPGESVILQQLTPLHWWNANHVLQSGGLVDALVDIGSSPKNFAQVGAARAPLGVDANGQAYLALDGVADFYQAGVPADWTFASDGTGCTYALIGSRTALATTVEAILGDAAADTTKAGFDIWWNFTSATKQGPYITVCCGTLNKYVVQFETGLLAQSGAFVFAMVIRTFGSVPNAGSVNAATSNPSAGTMAINGQPRTFGNISSTGNVYVSTPPTYALTLGRRADLGAGQFTPMRIYDVVVHNDAWADSDVDLWFQYARIRRGLAPQYGWPAKGAF